LAKRRRTSKAERERQQRQRTLMVVSVGLAAVFAFVVLFVVSRPGDGGAEAVGTELAGEEARATVEPASTLPEAEPTPTEPVGGEGLTVEGYPYLGSPDAPVKMFEYTDYFCGHCAYFSLEKVPLIEEEYVATGKVQYIMQYYALGQDARLLVVEAGACAADQGHFFEYQRTLFSNQQELANTPIDQWKDLLMQYAGQVGLDVATFEACWEQAPHQEQILTSINDARQKGVSGTPAFLINGELVVGNQPYEQFQAVIEQALAEATQ
jgi:protein-disulfide isomerase